MGFIDSALGFVGGLPLVGDLIGAGAEFAGAKALQNDAQAHDSAMFNLQAGHDKAMFGLESDFNAREALKSYNRQRSFTKDMPTLQMEGLKSAGLNPILAATGGFRPASGGMQQASAKASSSAKGSGGGSPPGARLMLGETAKRYAEVDLLEEKQLLTEAQKSKVYAETRKIESEQPKRDFKEFFWEVFDGSLRRFDEAFKKWSQNNRKMLDEWMDKYGLSWQSIKDDFKKYVTDASPGRNAISGGQGRRNRRNK